MKSTPNRLPVLAALAVISFVALLVLAKVPGLRIPQTPTARVLVLVGLLVLLVPAVWIWVSSGRKLEREDDRPASE